MKKLSNGLPVMRRHFGCCIVGIVPNISNGNYERGDLSVHNISISNDPLSGVNMCKRLQCEVEGINRDFDNPMKK